MSSTPQSLLAVPPQLAEPFQLPAITMPPMFGLTSEQRELQSLIPALGQSPMSLGSSPLARQGTAQLDLISQYTGGALRPANDPRTWTPEEAVSQTDRALARIGQVNPDLASQLAAERGRAEDSGGGLLGSILRVTGLGAVFEFVGRTSHIVPEIIHDWGKESVWKNYADAMSGHSDVSWDDVLVDDFGMERNWMTATVGFILDVGTDPLTYATFGLGGVGRKIAGETVAKAALVAELRRSPTQFGTLFEAASRQVGKKVTEEELAAAVFRAGDVGTKLTEEATRGILGRIRTRLGMVHPDAAPGVFFSADQVATNESIRYLLDIGDKAFTQSTRGGFSRLSDDVARKLGIDRAGTEAILREWVARGTGVGVGKALYQYGKAAAAGLGGWRFRLSIPVLDIRLAGARVLPALTKRLDFSVGRRFFAGISGEIRMEKLLASGEATVDDLIAYWRPGLATGPEALKGGFAGLRATNPELARKLAGGPFHHFGSALIPASEAMGRITAHLSPGAAVLRGGGLGAKYATDAKVAARRAAEEVTEEMLSARVGDELLSGPVAQRRMAEGWKLTTKTTAEEHTQLTERLTDYLDRMPVESRGQRAAVYYDRKLRELNERVAGGGQELPGERAALEADRDIVVSAEDFFRRRGPKGLEAADIAREQTYNKDAVPLRYSRTPDGPASELLEARDDLPVAEAQRFSRQGAVELHDKVLEAASPQSFAGVEVIDEGVLTHQGPAGTIYGAHVNITDQAIDTVPDELGSLERLGNLQADVDAARLAVDDLSRPGAAVTLTDPLEEVSRRADALRTAQTALAEGTRPSARMAGRLTNPYRIGRGMVNVIADVESGVDEMFDQIEGPIRETAEGIADPEMRAIVERALNRTEAKAEAVTARLQEMGHDGVIAADGRSAVIFRDPKGTIPLSRVTPGAQAATGRGHVPRWLTEEALNAARASRIAGLPGGTIVWLRGRLRETVGMTHAQAEEFIRREMANAGVALGVGQRALEVNPLKTIDRSVRSAADDVKNILLGRASRTIETLGFGGTMWNGKAVGIARFRYIPNEAAQVMLRQLGDLGDEFRLASERATELVSNHLPEVEAMARRAADGLQAEFALVDDAANRLSHLITSRTDETYSGPGLLSAAQRLDEGVSEETLQVAAWRAGRDLSPSSEFAELGNNVVRYAKLYRTGKKDIFWYQLDDSGKVLSVRASLDKRVSAYTALSAQHHGLGGKLHEIHWREAGVYDAADPFEAAAELLQMQNFSRAGANLNKSQVRKLAEDIKNTLHQRAVDAELDVAKKNAELTSAINEVNRLKARMTSEVAPVRAALVQATPESLNEAGMVALRDLGIPNVEDMAMPAFMAEELKQAVVGFGGLQGLHAQWRHFNNVWKELATWYYPGFHIRNAMGAFFNNLLGGVTTADYVFAGRVRRAASEIQSEGRFKWAKMRLREKEIVDGLKRGGTLDIYGIPVDELTYGDMVAFTSGMGLTAANGRTFAEPRLVVSETERLAAGKGRLLERNKATNLYLKSMRGAGTLTENFMRTAAFGRGMAIYGEAQQARLFTMMRHGDYTDLTDFEFRVVRDLVPFYKWMRTNIPFQVHQMLEAPGPLLAAQKLQGAVFTARGLDIDEERYKAPKWMFESFVIPTSRRADGYNAVMLDLPFSDLHIDTREFVSSALPLVRPLLENYVYHQSTFTGKPIEGKPIPLAGVFNTPGISHLLKAIGWAKEGPEGQLFISDTNQNLLNMVPVFSRFKWWAFSDPQASQRRLWSIFSAGAGLTLRPVDKESMTNAELEFYYSQVLPQVEHLRAMGVTLPTTQELASHLGTTDQILASMGIEPSPLAETAGPPAAPGALI